MLFYSTWYDLRIGIIEIYAFIMSLPSTKTHEYLLSCMYLCICTVTVLLDSIYHINQSIKFSNSSFIYLSLYLSHTYSLSLSLSLYIYIYI